MFPPDRDIHEIYDLKGSSDGRSASAAERNKKGAVVLKDLDLKRRLQLAPRTRTALLEQARKDSHFLETLNVMDYSLLLLVHKLAPNAPPIKYDFISVVLYAYVVISPWVHRLHCLYVCMTTISRWLPFESVSVCVCAKRSHGAHA